MPIRAKTVVRRRPVKGRRMPRRPRRSVPRPLGRAMIKRKSDYARIVESAENQLTLNANGEYGFNFTTSLSEFQRAQEVAHAYKYYRCAKVELTFIPYANVANFAAAPALRLPQLYFTLDRVANQFIEPSESEMLERGVSPKLFKRKFIYSWKPNLLQYVQMETKTLGIDPTSDLTNINAVNSIPLFDKWLPTQQSYGYASPVRPQIGPGNMVQPSANPYALRYYGATFFITQENGASEVAIGDLVTKVTWEFKGPRALKTNEPGPQVPVSFDTSMTNSAVANANEQPTNYP